MAFQKGQPRPANAGRKPGSANKKKLPKVSEFLAENNINLLQDLIDSLNDKALSPKAKADIRLELLSYCEAKPKASEVPEDTEDMADFDGIPNSEFLKLIKHPGTA